MEITLIQIQQFSAGVLAEIVRRQPPSTARTVFAWQIAVGPGIARTTSIELVDGVLRVTPRDDNWRQAVERASETILARMQHLLGADSVRTLDVLNRRP